MSKVKKLLKKQVQKPQRNQYSIDFECAITGMLADRYLMPKIGEVIVVYMNSEGVVDRGGCILPENVYKFCTDLHINEKEINIIKTYVERNIKDDALTAIGFRIGCNGVDPFRFTLRKQLKPKEELN